MFCRRRAGILEVSGQASHVIIDLTSDTSDPPELDSNSSVPPLRSRVIPLEDVVDLTADEVIDLTADDGGRSTDPTSALQELVSRAGLLLTSAQYQALLRNWEEVITLRRLSPGDHVTRVLSYIENPVHRSRLVNIQSRICCTWLGRLRVFR